MCRPLIAVSAAREQVDTAFGFVDCTKLTAAYTDAVYTAGGQPVILPVGDPVDGLLARMDGLLLTGGGDIDPAVYEAVRDPSVYGVRRDRDDFEIALYLEAARLGLPIFAICRGMQLINVLRGGSLLQHISRPQDHWQDNPPTRAAHSVSVSPESALAAAFGQRPTVMVNSYHHQALARLGHSLRVTALCDDVIEAVEADDADIVAVQWHPEQMAAEDELQRALFTSFVERAASVNPTATKEAS